ncbi:MAG TPA: hypothetical protein VFH70_06590 [Acidimicrobiales bacterium]|nr:hypothetical protein [Acidimicrobiales bacterium]
MSRLRIRIAGCAALTVGATFLYPGIAHAAAGNAALTASAWYWQGAVAGPVPASDPTVPSGDVAVSGPEVNSQADAETFLRFDLSAIPAGSTITSFVIVLPLDPQASQFTPSGVAAPIVACIPNGTWNPAVGPQPFKGKPAETCAPDAPRLKPTSNGHAYKVDIAAIAEQWLAQGNAGNGVAITDDPQNNSSSYQLVFGPAKALSAMTATVTYSPPPSPPAAGGVAVPPTTLPLALTPAPETVPAPIAPVPNQEIPVGAVTSPTTPTRSPGIANLPSGSPSGPAGSGATAAPPVASKQLATAGSAPPAAFWIAGLFLAAVLALCGLELGRTPTSAPASRRRGVAHLLAQRAGTPRIPEMED